MDLELDQSRILVTGASRGIGLAIAKSLLRERAQVEIFARQEQGVNQAVMELSQNFDSELILGLACDCGERSKLKRENQ